jgi:uncharacterized membrane protein
MAPIRNPIEWGTEQFKHATEHVESSGHSIRGAHPGDTAHAPTVRHIGVADLKDALARGIDDFGACRTDVVFLAIVYPVVGLVLAQFAFRQELVRLIFPLASGFALLGPIAAVGLYEMSRQREIGGTANWGHAFGMIRSPSFGAIFVLGLILLLLFLLWLGAANAIYWLTLGAATPAGSVEGFIRDVLTTEAGWTMIAVGIGVGFLFALVVLAISVVSFPLLLDRDVGLGTAIRTSFRAIAENPGPMAVWGIIVAAGLALGSIPLFLGLIVVMPVLGHATWHLYRKVVAL